MSNEKYVVVYITTETHGHGREIADALLTEKLAACVSIVPKVQSKFWWKGKIDVATESMLIVKTRADLLDRLVASVKSRHSYTVPEIIAVPIIGGNQDYLDWIDEVTAK